MTPYHTSEMLDRMRPAEAEEPSRNTVHLSFPLPDCKLNEIYRGDIMFRVLEMSTKNATIEILNLKKESGDLAEDKFRVVPAPS